MKVVVLTTDTKHHRYFVNRLAQKAEIAVILEQHGLDYWKSYWKWVNRHHRTLSSFIDNPYIHLGYPLFNYLQDQFEEKFFEGVPSEFTGLSDMTSFTSVNDPECVTWAKDYKPEVIVSFGTGLIKKGILEIDALKMNIHRGIIPKYRGLDSDLWAFYFRDFENVGTTVHLIEPRFDTGNILEQMFLVIEPHMKAYHIRYYTSVLATEMVLSILEQVRKKKNVPFQLQELERGDYYSFIPPIRRYQAIWRFNQYRKDLLNLAN